MTVQELIGRYRETSGERPRREDVRHAHWWIDQLGPLPATALSADLITRNVQTLAKRGRSDSTRTFYLRFLRRVCRWGLEQGYLTDDPSTTIALPTAQPPLLRVLGDEEEAALCAALGAPYSLWVRFALVTGLKQSEQFALRWRDVDLDRATLFLPDPRMRTVVALGLSAAAVAILWELRRIQPVSLWVFPDLRTPTRPANIHAFYTGRWETAVRRAGLPHVTWADLRTTCGVRLAQQGFSVADITRLLRQREVRRAYYYRAWQPGQVYITKPARPRAELVFSELSPEELQQLIGRDIATAPLTFQECCHLYASFHLKGRPSREQFERIYRQHWKAWRDRLPATITRKDIRLWFLALEGTPGLANKAATLLRGLYSWALRMELLACPNPVAGLIRFRQYARERFLSSPELSRLMDRLPHLPAKPRAFLLVLLLTGARKGEALQMRWADLDPTTRLWKKSRTKTGTGHVVPLPLQVMEALALLPRDSEWVFSGHNGAHWHRTSADKTWALIRARLNLEDVTLHDLRRSCASYLAMAGENLPIIQNVLNHRSLSQTSTYARLNVGAVDRALQQLADRFLALQHNPTSSRLAIGAERANEDMQGLDR